jgi:hypothetical protein
MQLLSAGRYVANVWRKEQPAKARENETEVNFAHPIAKEMVSKIH